MKKAMLAGAILAVVLGTLAPQTVAAEQKVDRTEMNAALAAIIALGIGVAIAKHDKDKNSGWNQESYGDPFSPSPHVVCLPKPQQCFERSHYSARWTRRIFGS